MSLEDIELRRAQADIRRMELEERREQRAHDLRRYCLDHAMSNPGNLTDDAEAVVRFAAILEQYVTSGSAPQLVRRSEIDSLNDLAP